MKVSARIFLILFLFFLIVAPVYWLMSHDPAGTSALGMSMGLTLMLFFYLMFTARRVGPGPDDRKDAEPHEGAGEQGFFSPHSWWPLLMAAGGAAVFAAVAVGFWMVYFAVPFFAYAIYGLVFEYYRGENKHY